jgi:hypothetical protein
MVIRSVLVGSFPLQLILKIKSLFYLLSRPMIYRFTGYINRIRGYHADKEKRPGYEMGRIDSWYYVLEDRFDHMLQYYPVKQSFYAREFPTSWRLIDTTFETS